MMLRLLQTTPSLDDYSGGPGGMLDAVAADLAAALGGWGLLGLLVGATILYISWEASPEHSLALPSALTVLIGGTLIPSLPGNYRSTAWAIIIVGLAAGFIAVGKRYVESGGPIR